MYESSLSQPACQDRAVVFINSLFDDVESLAKAKDLCSELSSCQRNLEEQLSFAMTEVPNKIQKAVEDAEEVSDRLSTLEKDQSNLIGVVHNQIADNIVLVNELSRLTIQIRELEKYTQYLTCISHFEDLSSDIQSALLIKSTERSVIQFTYMSDLAKDIQESKCQHLVQFVNETVTFWYKILSEKLSSEFDECLLSWQWPFIVTTVKSIPVTNAAEVREKLPNLFSLLAQLQLPEMLQKKSSSSSASSINRLISSNMKPLLVPLQLLLKPFQKRFVFHFYGNRKTNNLEKPEWYLTQTLSWIRDHQDFLRTRIQPELDKMNMNSLSAVVEFIRGLVVMVMDKLYADMPQLMVIDELFAHVLDEALTFHRELSTVYSYPSNQFTCLQIFIQPEPFKKWIHIEKQYAFQKMDSMLSSTTAWQSQYKDITDVDDLKVSECGESFMILLITITDRYKLLTSMRHRLEFLKLQLELLDDFRIRLLQVKKEIFPNKADHLNPKYCAILNTVNYILDILCQWTNLPFFVKLAFFKQNAAEDEVEEDTRLTVDNVDSSLFEDAIELFELMEKDMMNNILSFAMDDFKARSRSYRSDRWMALSSQKEFVSLALSHSACDMLLILKDHLHQIEILLNKNLFNSFWQQLTVKINQFLYKELIKRNHFNEGGANQLQFDMTRNLFPLFANYTTKPENYFKDVKEACIILTLTSGSAILIKDIIYRALHEGKTHQSQHLTDPIAALHDIHIYKLSPEEVELLLSLRIDIS